MFHFMKHSMHLPQWFRPRPHKIALLQQMDTTSKKALARISFILSVVIVLTRVTMKNDGCRQFIALNNQDCKALQRVVRLAERISGSTLPSLQGIYLKRCRSRAAKITKDSNHPGNHLFRLLPSGRRYRSLMAKTERLRKSFFPQAIRLLNTNSVP